jgi:ribonuclease HI
MHDTHDYALVFDGGSRGNPGPGYGSYQLTRVADGKEKIKRLEFGDHVTNNVAEYRALVAGLEDVAAMIKAAGRSASEFSVDIRGDSKLVVEQVNGRWKVRDSGLQPWHARAQALFRSFGKDSSLAWHDRSNSVRTLGH